MFEGIICLTKQTDPDTKLRYATPWPRVGINRLLSAVVYDINGIPAALGSSSANELRPSQTPTNLSIPHYRGLARVCAVLG